MKKISRRAFLNSSLLMTGALFMGQKTVPVSRPYPSYLGLYADGTLRKRVEELQAIYENCTLCPRDCRVDRTKKELGKCQATSTVEVSSAFPHFGEEKPLVGAKGSGTIFFSNCGLRCIYCQNYDISIEGSGSEISDRRLAEAMIRVQEFGCHNVNLVTPTHYVPSIVKALELAIPMGLKIPLVYNTGGYDKPETLRLLDGIVDIYLPDFKYWSPQNAAKYSSEAFSYPHYARLNFLEMHRQVGVLETDRRGIARRGVMVRHLVLPNRIAGTREILRFIAKNLSKKSYVNVMRQYRPEYRAKEYPELNRRLSRKEYNEALNWAKDFGLTRLDR